MTDNPQHPSQADHAQARFRHFAERDFQGSGAAAEQRVASALEFIAFRLGRIDDKLSELIALLKERQGGA